MQSVQRLQMKLQYRGRLCPARHTPATEEHGAVMVEWSLVVIGLLLGLMIFIDLANMLATYMALSQGAFEGTRAGQNYPQLEAGTSTDLAPTAGEYASCTTNTSATTFPCGHFFVQERVRYALEQTARRTSWSGGPPKLSIRCQFIPRGSDGGSSAESTVIVSVTAAYSGFLFRNFPLWASFDGPYLFQ